MLDIADGLVGSVAFIREFGELERHDLRLPIGFRAIAQLGFGPIVETGGIEQMGARDALLGQQRWDRNSRERAC